MRIVGTKKMNLADLKTNLFVRRELNQDHVLYLAELIEGGTSMSDPIDVTEDDEIVNGRHRKEAYELNKVKEITVRILVFDNEVERIAYAYQANTGGSLPPTREDTEHVIMSLLDRNESQKRIAELLGLPVGLTRNYIIILKLKRERFNLQRAVDAVVSGRLKPAEAAEEYKIEIERLKDELSGRKRKQKTNGVADMNRNLTFLHKSIGQKIASMLRRLSNMMEDGDAAPKQVDEIFEHLESLQRQSSRSVADWKKRIKAKSSDWKKN